MTLDFRPVGYVIGWLVLCLGATMAIPMMTDLYFGNQHWEIFLESMLITMLCGGFTLLACANGAGAGLTIRQTFLLTVGIWLVLPAFGALPLMLGVPFLNFTDAFFEAMSGLTTTGATVITGLDRLPEGILLWRSILQWLGGVGIVVVAMVFLPELRVGGMQIFRSESFDTMGKILPRAAQMASQISVVYLFLTLGCILSYMAAGLDGFEAIAHALTTVSTGGMATTDASFGAFGAGPHYVAVLFMILAALPFVRYVQLLAGSAQPLLRDSQVRVFLMFLGTSALVIACYAMVYLDEYTEPMFREGIFNVVSIVTGTGFASSDYGMWGSFSLMAFFFLGLVGGCAGSTACSVKIFRYQLLFTSVKMQIKALQSPHGIFVPRYQGERVSRDVLNSVMAFFMLFLITLGIVAVLLSLTGLDFITSVSGAATAIANVGPGLGSEIGPAGNFAGLNDAAKWILSMTMVIGRLEIMSVLTIFSVAFWRN